MEELARHRDLLNALVANSVGETERQVRGYICVAAFLAVEGQPLFALARSRLLGCGYVFKFVLPSVPEVDTWWAAVHC